MIRERTYYYVRNVKEWKYLIGLTPDRRFDNNKRLISPYWGWPTIHGARNTWGHNPTKEVYENAGYTFCEVPYFSNYLKELEL